MYEDNPGIILRKDYEIIIINNTTDVIFSIYFVKQVGRYPAMRHS